MNTTLVLDGYMFGAIPAAVLAFSAGKVKGIKGLKLLFGAVVLSASWPLWAVGATLLAVIGMAFAVAALTVATISSLGLLVGALWVMGLLKTLEFLGWCNE